MTHSKIHLALGVLYLVALIYSLIRFPRARGADPEHKIGYMLFMLFLLVAGIGYLLSMPYLRDTSTLALLAAMYALYLGRRRRSPEA